MYKSSLVHSSSAATVPIDDKTGSFHEVIATIDYIQITGEGRLRAIIDTSVIPLEKGIQ